MFSTRFDDKLVRTFTCHPLSEWDCSGTSFVRHQEVITVYNSFLFDRVLIFEDTTRGQQNHLVNQSEEKSQ